MKIPILKIVILSGFLAFEFVGATTARSDPKSSEGPEGFSLSNVPRVFVHPGLTETVGDVNTAKQRIAAGLQPWAGQFTLFTKRYARYYTPKPTTDGIVSSGIAGAADHFALAEFEDSQAAYDLALMWAISGNPRYAQNAVDILNAWTQALTVNFHYGAQAHKGGNWYLQDAWVAALSPLAAELLRPRPENGYAGFSGWNKSDIEAYKNMLETVYLPPLHNRFGYGNREFAVAAGMAAIGVFADDRAAYLEGVNHWVSYVPEYFYLAKDGPKPLKMDYWTHSPSNAELAKIGDSRFPDSSQSWIEANVPNLGDDHGMTNQTVEKLWYEPGTFINGACAETGRDLGHSEGAFFYAVNLAQIAYNQGNDFWGLYADRLAAFMELESAFRLGLQPPNNSYNGKLNPGNGLLSSAFELAYGHLHDVLGLKLPNTARLILGVIRNINIIYPGYLDGWIKPSSSAAIAQTTFIHEIFAPVLWSEGSSTMMHGVPISESADLAPSVTAP